MPGPLVPVALGIGQILGGLFGNLFGARQQAKAATDATKIQTQAALRAAELEKQTADEALAYAKSIDARDYRDWLIREARDRKDFEITERRKAPYRALGDAAVRTLADYIRVPGMHAPQEIAVQEWTDPYNAAPMTQPMGTRTLAGYTQNESRPYRRSMRDVAQYGL